MKKRLRLIITISLVCIGIVLAVVFMGRDTPEDPPDTTVVTRGDIMVTIPVRGNLEKPDKAYLTFGVTGTVEEVLVNAGASVEKDQILARLDAPSLKLSVEAAEAQYKNAQRALREAERLLREARDSLGDGGPIRDLVVSLLEQQVDGARAALEMAELNLETARLSLQEAEIVAPFDGVVGDVAIAEGDKLSAAALGTPAIILVGTAEMEMRGFIDELDIAEVEVGQEANIRLDALPDRKVKGEVAFISLIGTVRAGVVSYEATIALEDNDQALRDGMTATADVIVDSRGDVLLIPNRAIQGTREEPMVQIYIDERVEEREITIGLSDGRDTEVLSGLEEGEKVVLPGRGR